MNKVIFGNHSSVLVLRQDLRHRHIPDIGGMSSLSATLPEHSARDGSEYSSTRNRARCSIGNSVRSEPDHKSCSQSVCVSHPPRTEVVLT